MVPGGSALTSAAICFSTLAAVVTVFNGGTLIFSVGAVNTVRPESRLIRLTTCAIGTLPTTGCPVCGAAPEGEAAMQQAIAAPRLHPGKQGVRLSLARFM